MIVAAAPIRPTDSTRPTIRTVVCSLAAPATASTLSSDMETSAMTIWMIAWRMVLGGAAPGSASCGSASSRRSSRVSSCRCMAASRSRSRRWCINSRQNFQHTQSSSKPPARVRPMISSSWVVASAKHDAQDGRGGDTDQDDLAALFLGQAGCGHADDDRVVARQHQIDHDDLAECDQFGPESGQIHAHSGRGVHDEGRAFFGRSCSAAAAKPESESSIPRITTPENRPSRESRPVNGPIPAVRQGSSPRRAWTAAPPRR